MAWPIKVLVALLIFGLSAVTAATAARSDRDRGVRSAQPIACSPATPAKPADNGGRGGDNGNGGGNGNSDGTTTDGTTTGDTRGNGNSGTPVGNGGGNSGNAGGNSGNGGGNSGNGGGNSGNGGGGGNTGNANGGGNAGGNGQGGRNAGGNGHGNGGRRADGSRCVDPPADPAGDRVAGGGELPPPAVGESINVETTSGVVRVKRPGADFFEPLGDSAQLPARTVLDARDGALLLTSATGDGGNQTAAFTGAKFEVRQEPARAAVTELVLRGGDFEGCERLDHDRRATQIRNGFIAARGARSRRGLWGTGRGRFRTRGRWGSATVRGTVWHVEDRCNGTLTTVTRGVVKVADFGLDRTATVRAGESYFARTR